MKDKALLESLAEFVNQPDTPWEPSVTVAGLEKSCNDSIRALQEGLVSKTSPRMDTIDGFCDVLYASLMLHKAYGYGKVFGADDFIYPRELPAKYQGREGARHYINSMLTPYTSVSTLLLLMRALDFDPVRIVRILQMRRYAESWSDDMISWAAGRGEHRATFPGHQ